MCTPPEYYLSVVLFMKKKKYIPYIVFLLITFAVAGIAGIITAKGMPAFDKINKPAFTPPDIVFPIVWTILYALMAIGAAMVWNTGGKGKAKAISLFALQLVMNFLWVVWFFGIQAYLFSFIWLIALIAAVAAMTRAFYDVNAVAAYSQIPYIAWLTLAALLNLAVYIMN